MARGDSFNILGRGAFLVGVTDVCMAVISIISCIIGIVHPSRWIRENWEHGREPKIVCSWIYQNCSVSVTELLGAILIIHLCYLIFGVLLLVGVRTGRAGFVLSWYIPNIVLISVVFSLSFILAFTRLGLLSMVLPGWLCFRAFETWIVGEFRWILKYQSFV